MGDNKILENINEEPRINASVLPNSKYWSNGQVFADMCAKSVSINKKTPI